jgi:hypothetical protein
MIAFIVFAIFSCREDDLVLSSEEKKDKKAFTVVEADGK